MFICENTGKETFVSGSTKPAASTEGFKPKLLLYLPDLLIGLGLQSDAKLFDITIDPESERDSHLPK